MKNSYSSYRFIATLLLLITLGIGNMWGWTAVYLNGTFDVTGGSESPNWNKATYQINYELEESNSGHYFLPFYATSGDKYWRLYQQKDDNNYQLSPYEDNIIQNVGTPGYKVGKNGEKNFKSTTILTGVTAVHINQGDGNGDESPGVWLERPTIYIWHNWNGNTENWGNNGGSGQKSMTDNEDGTYSYDGNYSGSSTGTNVGIEGSAPIKKYFADDAATKYGTLTAGNLCRFVWDADGYVGYDDETDHRGALSIYKLYTITYHTDGSTSGSAPTDATYYPHGSDAPVLDNTGLLARADNKVFAGWATTAERATAGTVDYDPAAGDKITSISADMNLYPVWKTGYYFISLAGRDADGTKNTTDFFTPKTLNDNTRRAVNGIEFSKSVFRLSKTPTAGDNPQTFEGINMGEGKNFFAYDTKTTQTDISIYVYNDDESAIPIYYRVLKEGSIQDVVSVNIPANSGMVVNIPTITHTKGTRVLFGAGTRNGSDYGKINFAQVRAIETGTAVPQAGQAGFELAVPGRFTASKDAASSIDGLTCIPNDNVHIISGGKNTIPLTGEQGVEATQYISFITSGPVQLQVTPKDAQDRVTFYVKKGSRTFTSSDTPYGTRGTTTSVNLPEAGTWYILSGESTSSKDIVIKKIAFVAAPVVTYDANGGTGTTASSTCFVAANGFTRENYTFSGWNTTEDGNGKAYAVGNETLTDLTLYAQWIANPSIVYHTDGSSSGTAPATARVPYGGDGTAADNTGLLQHAGDTVFAGWATSAGSTTIEYLPGAAIEAVTADVNLYPVWKKGYYFISLSGSGATGTRNDADFLTGKSLSSNDLAYAVNEVAFSRSYFKFDGTPNKSGPQNFSEATVGSRFIAYDTKTDMTDIYVYLYNNDAAAKTLYYRVLKEGAIGDVQEVAVAASAKVVVAIPTIEHTKGTRVLFGVSDEDNLFITQIKAVESGTALPQAGEAGYELTVPGRPTCETTGKSGRIDGLEYVAEENVKLISGSSYIRITGTSGTECSQYFKFTNPEPVQLQIATPTDNTHFTFYVKDGKTFTEGTDTKYDAKNTLTKVNVKTADTWYILGDLCANRIAFAAAPEVTYDANGGTGEMAATLFTVAANTFSKEDYEFAGWNTDPDGNGTPYDADDEVLDDVTLYAQWSIKTYTVTYHTNGASSGTAPVDGSSPYEIHSDVTVKDNTGLMQHATKVFAGWATSLDRANDGTVDYNPATGATIEDIAANVDLYPVWKDGAYFISLSGSSDTGTRNDADFLTGQSLSSNNPAYAVNEVAFSRSYFKFGGTPRGSDPQDFSGNTVGPRFIAYDTKTTSTDIYVYVKNDTTVSVPFYYRVLKEGAIQGIVQVNISAGTAQVVTIPTISHSKNTRVLFGAGTYSVPDFDNLRITQIKAVESGTALPQAGQDGYELAIPGRAVGNAKTGSIDGLEFSSNVNVTLISGSNYISLTGTSGSACTEYIKFSITEPMQLRVSCDNSRYAFYVKQGTTFTTGTDTEYSAQNTTTSINLLDTGDWYILASEAHITKVAFVDLSTITYDLNGGTRFFADPDYYTSEQEVTLHPASKPGYVFAGWYDNAEFTGSPITTIPVGSTTNKNFYAKWTEASCAIGNIFTYEVSGSSAKRDTLPDGTFVNCAPDYATITGGTAVFGAVGNTAYIVAKNHRLEFINAHSRLIINLGCALQEGDSITITGTGSCVYALTATNERSTGIVTSCESDGDTKKSTYIIPAGSPLEGASTLYVWRNESAAYLLTLTICRKELIIEGDGNWSTKLAGVTIDDAVKLRGTITVDITDAKAKAVTLDHSGTHAGKLIVNAGKELVVAQTVRQFNGTANVPTEEENLVLGSSASGNGALVMGAHDGTNHATVYFYSKSGGAKNSTASINQFIGTPFTGETNNWLYNYYNSWLLKVDYSEDTPAFALLGASDSMDPFAGYCVIYNGDAGHTYEMTGTLVATNDKTCSDLHYVSGDGGNSNNENLLANSWTAPIRIAAFETGDFVKTDATIYIFNSGSKDDVDNKDATKGQYITIPISSADDAVIQSMQSFSVYTNASGGSSVTLDYSKLVYDPAVAGTAAVGPNKAPQREETTRRMRILVQGESGFGDVLSLLEREDMTVGFDNGWDGRKMYGESFAPQFYAVTPDGNMAVNSVPDWEGTVLGFKAGSEDNTYTFSFEYNEPEPLYLLDTENDTYTRVLNENTYTFATTDKNDHSRFILTRHAPQTPTEVTNVLSDKAPCTKILLDNNLYILRDGRLYNVTGAMVK